MSDDAARALALLRRLGAGPHLLLHHEMVVDAAEALTAGLADFDASFDAGLVLAGAAVHDAGKILHPGEMHGPGARHEPDGHALLVQHGEPVLARFCLSHARWDAPAVPLEDLLVAAADKLWKGKRVAALEQRVIEQLASESGHDRWDVLVAADDLFERVAADADRRLAATRSGTL
ncbi:MAG: HD domain-containing protein [Myxococcota bacterium]